VRILSPTEKGAAPWKARLSGLVAGISTLMGRKEEAAGHFAKLESMTPIGTVAYHLMVSEIEEGSIEQREPFAVICFRLPSCKPLRESPRSPKLAGMMNLPERVS
jgi:hypothetical protein